MHQAVPEECFFWGIHGQAELDLLMIRNGKRLGFEFKYADAPTLTKSMEVALDLLKLDSLEVIYPGEKSYALAPGIMAKGLRFTLSH